MVQGCTLKLYFKAKSGNGIEIGSHVGDKYDVVAQWLSARSSKVKSRYLVALFNQRDECIDAKYVSIKAALKMLSSR
ncbi:hypothetical protein LCL85_12130 [Vibrio alginolyticus]|nr:hypothetical protein [Vibrio alginolyticus]